MTPGWAHTFRTDLVPLRERLTYWNDVAVTTFGNIAVDAASSAFSGRLERKRLGEITVAQVWSTPACVHGGASGGARPVDGWFLLLNERGTSHFVQKGRETCLGPGELTVLDADTDYRIRFSQPNAVIVLHLPSGPVRNVNLETRIARRHETGEIQLLSAFLRRLASLDPSEHLDTVQFTSLAAEILNLTWPIRAPDRGRRSVGYWRERALEIIARRLAEPDLNAESISRNLGISTRYLHLVFASTGQSVSAVILQRRLEHAARRLRTNHAASITEVASSVGFTDLSHFCRSFRRRFGASASRYRQLR